MPRIPHQAYTFSVVICYRGTRARYACYELSLAFFVWFWMHSCRLWTACAAQRSVVALSGALRSKCSKFPVHINHILSIIVESKALMHALESSKNKEEIPCNVSQCNHHTSAEASPLSITFPQTFALLHCAPICWLALGLWLVNSKTTSRPKLCGQGQSTVSTCSIHPDQRSLNT